MSVATVQELETVDVLAPEQPVSLEDTGCAAPTISALIVKTLHSGEASGMDLADRIRLPYGILEPLLEYLRVEMHVQVKSAAFDNGLLKIELVREIPEAMKPRRIAINGASTDNVQKLEAKAA